VSGGVLSSASDDEVGGFHARLREQLNHLTASVGKARAAVLRRSERSNIARAVDRAQTSGSKDIGPYTSRSAS
jgi:hypothetical protein